MNVLHCGIINKNHATFHTKAGCVTFATEADKRFGEGNPNESQRKVRKSDYFSHLFLVSMVSVFDSSHIPNMCISQFCLSNLHYEQVS